VTVGWLDDWTDGLTEGICVLTGWLDGVIVVTRMEGSWEGVSDGDDDDDDDVLMIVTDGL